MSELLEAVMIISFGLSWPINVVKSYKARTCRGKSLSFLCFICFGYIAGIAAKLMNVQYMSALSTKWYVLACYALNLVMVCADMALYFRNHKYDKELLN